MNRSILRRISCILVAAMLTTSVSEFTWAELPVYAFEEQDLLDDTGAGDELVTSAPEAEEDITAAPEAEEDITAAPETKKDTAEESIETDPEAKEDTAGEGMEAEPEAGEGIADETAVKGLEGGEIEADEWLKYYNYVRDEDAHRIILKSSKGEYYNESRVDVFVPAKTTISGNEYTTVLDNSGNDKSLWANDKDIIKTIKIDEGVKAAADCSYLFYGLTKLEEIDLKGLDTSDVTKMLSMFNGDTSLKTLDISGLNTSKVENMKSMFYNCKKLESLSINGINTGAVTDMYGMFSNAESLKALDLSGLNTSEVTTMREMFSGCYKLKELNLEGFNTSKVISMRQMFGYCRSLMDLDLGSFDTSKVTDFSYMFYDTSTNLTGLDIRNFNMNGSNSISYTGIFPANAVYLYLPEATVKSYNFSDYNKLAKIFYKGSEAQWTALNNTLPAWVEIEYGYTGPAKRMSVTPDKGKSVSDNWYEGYYDYYINRSLQKLVLLSSTGKMKTEVVHEAYIPAQTKIDGKVYTTLLDNSGNDKKSLWSADRDVITSIKIQEGVETAPNCSYLFADIPGLTGLDIKGLNTSYATDMSNMFKSDVKLKTLDLSGLNTSEVRNMSCMFSDCTGLEGLSINRIDTGAVTSMEKMFYNAESLKTLDLSGLNTSRVRSMEKMFYYSHSLRDIDFTGVNTEKVENMNGMFKYCYSLMDLDLTGFDTTNVTNYADMFAALSKSISVLDLRSFNMNGTNNYSGMFSEDVVNLYLSVATVRNHNFNYCTRLARVYYAGTKDQWDVRGNTLPDGVEIIYGYTETVSGMRITPDKGKSVSNNWYEGYYDYYINRKYQKLVLLSSTGKMKTEGKQEAYIPAQTKINGKVYTTLLDNSGNGTKSLWYNDRDTITSLKIQEGVETIANCSYLFASMSELTGLDIKGLDTSNVSDMSNMFNRDAKLKTLDLSGLNTSEVRNMSYMFYYCTGLEYINMDNIDTGAVTDMNNMFYNASALRSVDLSGFNTSNVRNMNSMFESCTSLTELDVTGFNTEKVNNFSGMFRSIGTGVDTLDLRSFNINSNASTQGMFSNDVVSLYLSVATVSSYNFNSSGKLAHIYYAGTENQWKAKNNTVKDSVTIHYAIDPTPVPPKKCTVIFDPNGGSVEVTSRKVTFGGTYGYLPVPVREKHDFEGWFTGSVSGSKIEETTEVTVSEDHVIYAHWKEIAIVSADGITVSPNEITLELGGTETGKLIATITPENTTDKTVTWESLSTNIVTVDDKGNLTARGEGTTYVKAKTHNGKEASCQVTVIRVNNIRVTFDPNATGVTAPNPKMVTFNRAYGDLPSVSRTDYKFLGWYTAKTGGSKVDKNTTVTVNTAHTLYAHWQAESSGGGTNSGKDGTAITAKKLDIKAAFDTSDGGKYRYKILDKTQKKFASVNTKGILTTKKNGKVTVTLQKKEGTKWQNTTQTATYDIVVPKGATVAYGVLYYQGQVKDLSGYISGSDLYPPDSWDTSKVKSGVAAVDTKTGMLTVGSVNGTARVYAVYGTGTNARKVKVSVKINHKKLNIAGAYSTTTNKTRYKILNKDEKKIASVSSKGILTVKKDGTVEVTRQEKVNGKWVDGEKKSFTVKVPLEAVSVKF